MISGVLNILSNQFYFKNYFAAFEKGPGTMMRQLELFHGELWLKKVKFNRPVGYYLENIGKSSLTSSSHVHFLFLLPFSFFFF